jgi:transcription initiation factor TFIIE subunit alpha
MPRHRGPLFSAVIHPRSYSLKDDDLAGRVGLQVKELNKLMATLEKDGLIQA